MSERGERVESARAAGTKKLNAIAAEAARENKVASLLDVTADVLRNRRPDQIHALPAVDAAAVWMLYAALTGTNNGKLVKGADRNALFDSAMTTLAPAIEAYAQDEQQREWVDDNIRPKLAELKSDLAFVQADERVRGAIVLPGNHVVDPNDDRHPHEQAEALHEAIPKLVETLMQLNEIVVGLNEERIKEQVERILHGLDAESVKIGSLVELGNMFSAINGYLVLTDDELQEQLRHAPDNLSRARNMSELVKAVVQFTGGTLGIVTSTVGLVARAAGEPEIASLCSAVSRKVGFGLGTLVGLIDAIRGVMTLWDSNATGEQKVEAAADIATAGVPAVLRLKGITEIAGVSVGTAAIAAELGYGELKLALRTYWAASQGLVAGLMGPAFECLRSHGGTIAGFSEAALKARALISSEHDPGEHEALSRVLAVHVMNLGETIDSLLSDLAPPELEAGMARKPGAYQILRDALAPVRAFRGARETETVMLGASVALRCLEVVFSNKDAIVDAAASHRTIADVIHHAAQKTEARE